jgi:hypothetical protein
VSLVLETVDWFCVVPVTAPKLSGSAGGRVGRGVEYEWQKKKEINAADIKERAFSICQ